MQSDCDIVIVGGGIVGLSTAMALTAVAPRSRLLVLEAEDRLAAHQTGHNSGVIHSGLYYRPGSLKATNCTTGREMLYEFCARHAIPHERCGKLVVATGVGELSALNELEQRGRANGLRNLRRLGPDEIRDVEPNAGGLAGLRVEETGIVDYPAVAAAFASEARAGGAVIETGTRVLKVAVRSGEVALETSRGTVIARHLVNCAGLQSDRLARWCGLDPGVRIIPFRGEYYELRAERRRLVKHLIYPVPDPRFPFLGVHFTRLIGGGVEAGPNAVLALRREGYRWSDVSPRDLADMAAFPGFWRMVDRYWKTGLGEIHRSLSRRAFARALQRLVPEVQEDDLVPVEAGVRAQAVGADGRLIDDFHLVEAPRMIHVLNAPSPAATASLSIGRHLAGLARKSFGLA